MLEFIAQNACYSTLAVKTSKKVYTSSDTKKNNLSEDNAYEYVLS